MSASSVAPPPNSSNPADQPYPTPDDLDPEERAEYELHARKMRDYGKFKHYASVSMLVLAPTLALMPPRKFDLYTMALTAGFVASASQLTTERYGMGIIDVVGRKYTETTGRRVGESAGRLLEEKKEESSGWKWSSSIPTEKGRVLQEQIQESRPEEQRKKPAVLEKLWMGDEKPGWRERRLQEEKEALDRGETYGDLIRRQVSDVWNWGEKKGEELKEKDREVLREREQKGER